MSMIATHNFSTRFKKLTLPVALAIALGGCSTSNGVSIVEGQQTGYFAAEEYTRDESMGDIAVVVRGSAFGTDQQTLANLVVNDMQGADWGPHAQMAVSSTPDSARMYFYVMMVNGPLDIGGSSLCARPSQPLPGAVQAPGEMRLEGALCRFDKAAASVSGRAVGVSGPNDPKVRELIAGAVRELTIPNQYRIDHGNDEDTFDLYR
jgi:hypothetical protein